MRKFLKASYPGLEFGILVAIALLFYVNVL